MPSTRMYLYHWLPVKRRGLRTFAVTGQLEFISDRPRRGPSTIAITFADTVGTCTSSAFLIERASASTLASGTAVRASGTTTFASSVIIPRRRIITATRWRGTAPFVPPNCRGRVLRPLNAQSFTFENPVVHFIVRIFCIPFVSELDKSIPASRW